MWEKPWGYRESFIIGSGLFIAGEALQMSIGGVRWSLLAFPSNAAVAVVYIALLCLAHRLSGRAYILRWLSGTTAASASLVWTAALTVVMGLVRQRPAGSAAVDSFGFTRMVSAWPFVLLYLWMLTALGMTILRTLTAMNLRKLPFLVAHIGLFVALGAATLGSADMRRLRMTVSVGQTEWRATDATTGQLAELPLAIELKRFTIDEYPPKLMLIDNATGQTLPKGQPASLLLEDDIDTGTLGDWEITVDERLPMAAAMMSADTMRFVEYGSEGATTAVHLKAFRPADGASRAGWVSCGSFSFPYIPLKLDTLTSLVMPDLEPRRFASDVTVYTRKGERRDAVIEVNRPLDIEGWDIYQLSYDSERGRWSEYSVFELTRDPWLPVVYAGIVLLALGAMGLFMDFGKRKEKTTDDLE
ncbi:MAG: cytochrome c biogenesis protein ResB [Mediterranea sp.]|nr:cytochrome c biogenesis protein ResB [Mediterranea sp.]